MARVTRMARMTRIARIVARMARWLADLADPVELFLVTSCYGNRDKLRPDGPLGSCADLTFTLLLL